MRIMPQVLHISIISMIGGLSNFRKGMLYAVPFLLIMKIEEKINQWIERHPVSTYLVICLSGTAIVVFLKLIYVYITK